MWNGTLGSFTRKPIASRPKASRPNDAGTMPPAYRNLWLLPSRSSSSVTTTPAFRNASSRRRWASVSKLKTTFSKISASGLKVTFVPRFFVVPVATSSLVGLPRSYVCW